MSVGLCRECGAPLSAADSDRGVCGACLLGFGLDASSGADRLGAGSTVGPYEIRKVLGEGGMGLVFLAEQTEPIRRQVALKIVRPGLGRGDVIARFESERRMVALMDHPNIAQVHEAGITADGRPYVAMEYVPGRPITEYCDRLRLSIPERLELFLPLCRAIQHAHHKGIIHRDIKPSNVLVTEVDGQALVKVIDFGIAKAIHPDRLASGTVTRQGMLLGTPSYMSPEQAGTGGRDVDTRTDVYALGLLLYELAVGRQPFLQGVSEADVDEVRRRIRELEPPRPSVLLRALGGEGDELARARATDVPSLERALREDLDWIVVKALEKDPARRYVSPHELATDVERHLRDEPVAAGPPGTAYRVRKFVRRHRLGVGVAASAVLVPAVFAVVLGVQAGRIARERDRANREADAAGRVSQFLVDLFQVSDPSQARGDAVTAREILDAGASRIEKELTGDPEVQARLMATMGAVYKNLGNLEPAAALLDKAKRIRLAVLGPEHPDTLQTNLEIAELLFLRGQIAEAETLLGASLAAAESALGKKHPLTAATLADLAVMVHHRGDLSGAEVLYRDALERRNVVLGPDHPETMETTNNLAALLMARGLTKEAEPYLRAAHEGRRRSLGPEHPASVDSMMNLGVVLQVLERYSEAEPLCREAMTINRKIRPEHPKTLVSINNLGKLLDLEGRFDEAEPLYREALRTFEMKLGLDHADTITTMGNLGELYTSQGKYREAEELLARALSAARRAHPGDNPVTGYTLRKYGRLQGRTGRLTEAEATLQEAYGMLAKTAGPDHAQTRRAAADLADVRSRRGP